MYLCKIFESSTRNDLNSIPGVIDSLPERDLSDPQKRNFEAFGAKYGNHVVPVEAKSYLLGTLGLFCGIHSASLRRLKEFRDTIGAHSDSKAAVESLPSHAEFESFFAFAADFYELVSDLYGEGAATIKRRVGRELIKLMESSGVEAPRFDFDQGAQ